MDLESVSVAPIDPRSPSARECLAAYAAELAERFPEGYRESDLADPAELSAPYGAFLVATHAAAPIGCGGLRTVDAGIGEIRHMWVHAEFRRIGLGRLLIAELERAAGDLGLTALRLGTHRSLPEAVALYRSLGYTETEPYEGTAHTDHWFAKRLR